MRAESGRKRRTGKECERRKHEGKGPDCQGRKSGGAESKGLAMEEVGRDLPFISTFCNPCCCLSKEVDIIHILKQPALG